MATRPEAHHIVPGTAKATADARVAAILLEFERHLRATIAGDGRAPGDARFYGRSGCEVRFQDGSIQSWDLTRVPFVRQ